MSKGRKSSSAEFLCIGNGRKTGHCAEEYRRETLLVQIVALEAKFWECIEQELIAHGLNASNGVNGNHREAREWEGRED